MTFTFTISTPERIQEGERFPMGYSVRCHDCDNVMEAESLDGAMLAVCTHIKDHAEELSA